MLRHILFTLMLLVGSLSFVAAQTKSDQTGIPDSANRTDPQGNKTGYWIEKTGEYTSKGEYRENKKVRSWVTYYGNGMIYKLENYENGIKEGISLQFDRKGKISLIEHFKSGLSHGKTTLYSQLNELPVSETEYIAGKKNGLYRQFYENGKIQEETWYMDDKKDGLSRWNNKSGMRIAEYNYKAGNFDGIQKTFYDNDSLQSVTFYKDNNLSGESKEYYRNGKLKISGKYLNGQKEGPWTLYDEMGKVEKVIRYKDGQEVPKK